MAREIPVTQARDEFADLVNRVAYGSERVVLTRHGRPVAAIVPSADLTVLERHDTGLPSRQQTGSAVRLTSTAAPGAVTGPPAPPAEPLRVAAEHSPLHPPAQPS